MVKLLCEKGADVNIKGDCEVCERDYC